MTTTSQDNDSANTAPSQDSPPSAIPPIYAGNLADYQIEVEELWSAILDEAFERINTPVSNAIRAINDEIQCIAEAAGNEKHQRVLNLIDHLKDLRCAEIVLARALWTRMIPVMAKVTFDRNNFMESWLQEAYSRAGINGNADVDQLMKDSLGYFVDTFPENVMTSFPKDWWRREIALDMLEKHRQ